MFQSDIGPNRLNSIYQMVYRALITQNADN